MTKENQVESQNVADLIKQFESDILDDTRRLASKVEGSKAQKKLVAIGKEALRPIIDHLHKNPPSSKHKLDRAWTILISYIETDIDSNGTAPLDLGDFPGWIEWAEKFA